MKLEWVLDCDGVVFTSGKINESKAFDELYDQFWDMRRHQCMERDGYKCVICGSGHSLSVDHIKSRGAGGTDEMENLRTLCLYHHDMRHSNPLIDIEKMKGNEQGKS